MKSQYLFIIFSLFSNIVFSQKRNIDDLDFSRSIFSKNLVFTPFWWSAGNNNGILWHKNYKVTVKYSENPDPNGRLNAEIQLFSKAYENKREEYLKFVSENDIRYRNPTQYREDGFKCGVKKGFSKFVLNRSGKIPVTTSLNRQIILCRFNFRFFADEFEQVKTDVNDFLNRSEIFDIDVKIPQCDTKSPTLNTDTLISYLLKQEALTLRNGSYYGDYYRVAYFSVIYINNLVEIKDEFKEDFWKKFINRFEIGNHNKISSNKIDLERKMVFCLEEDIPVKIVK